MVLDLGSLVGLVILICLVAMVCGFLHFIVGRAPFFVDPWKSYLQWFIIAVAGLIIIGIVLSFFGYPIVRLR